MGWDIETWSEQEKKYQEKGSSERYNKFVKTFLDKNHVFETKEIKTKTLIYLKQINELKLPKKK